MLGDRVYIAFENNPEHAGERLSNWVGPHIPTALPDKHFAAFHIIERNPIQSIRAHIR